MLINSLKIHINTKFLTAITTILISTILLTSCTHQPNEKAQLKGVGYSPYTSKDQDINNFLKKASEVGNVIVWSNLWEGQLDKSGSEPFKVTERAEKYGLSAIIMTDLTSASVNDAELSEKYRSAVINYVKKYKPEYFGLGNEINVRYTEKPEEYEDFMKLNNEIYTEIKNISPQTKVITTFQLELIKGLQGGLFGGENNPEDQARWEFLSGDLKYDIAGFTTYPGLIYKNPSEIPEDYYSEITKHTDKDIAFVKVGWFRSGPVEWESSEDEQAEFIKTFGKLTKDTDPEIIVWGFLYDQNAQKPFDTTGLLKVNQEESKAFKAWSEL